MNRIDIEKKLHDLEQMAAICVAGENISEFTERELKINKLVFDRIKAHVADLRAFLNLLPIQNINVSALSALYDKRLEYEYQIEKHKEGSKERIEIEAKFNAIYEAEGIVKDHSR